MVILVLNCGSSSIKYQVIDMEDASSKLLAKGIVERIGLPEGDLTHKPVGKEPFELHQPIPDHTTGIKLVLDALTDPAHGVIASLDEVKAVGHRVAHGGEFFPESCIVTEDVKAKIRSLFEIAPLHNPANLEGVLSIEKVLPGVKQVTVFDTSFHQSIPAVNYMYALPHAYYEKYRVRKYGFHGTSHKYVAKVGAELAGLDFHNSRIITCHIGNGGSVTAILNGKSYDTSMGFSPLDGLVMGTRCGQVDASAITFIGEKEGMSYAELNTMMNKKSGVQGLTDISSDMRDIDRAYDEGNLRAILARDMYYGRIKKFIGEYAAEMSDASGTNLLDVSHRCWSEEILKKLHIDKNLLPPLLESSDPAGRVTAEAAAATGLCEGTVVAAGGGDNACAAVGTGVVGEGGCNISLGTSGTLFISSQKFKVDRHNALHAFAHADGGYHLMGCILSAASCNKWLMEDILGSDDYAAEQAAIGEEALGENDVFFLPYLMGERSPINDTNARGTLIGMTMDTTRSDITQAVLEGVAFAIRDSLEVARSLGLEIKRSMLFGF